MFEDFEKIMQFYEGHIKEMWYDEGCFEVMHLISRFTSEDWGKIYIVMSSKTDVWKDMLAYCMYNSSNKNHLKVLLQLSKTNNERLFRDVVASLVKFDLREIEEREELMNRIEQLISSSDPIAKVIFMRFLEKNTIEGRV